MCAVGGNMGPMGVASGLILVATQEASIVTTRSENLFTF